MKYKVVDFPLGLSIQPDTTVRGSLLNDTVLSRLGIVLCLEADAVYVDHGFRNSSCAPSLFCDPPHCARALSLLRKRRVTPASRPAARSATGFWDPQGFQHSPLSEYFTSN
ncbi:hypothetical protein CBL_11403 [Carabus blaptoides fortunei]